MPRTATVTISPWSPDSSPIEKSWPLWLATVSAENADEAVSTRLRPGWHAARRRVIVCRHGTGLFLRHARLHPGERGRPVTLRRSYLLCRAGARRPAADPGARCRNRPAAVVTCAARRTVPGFCAAQSPALGPHPWHAVLP